MCFPYYNASYAVLTILSSQLLSEAELDAYSNALLPSRIQDDSEFEEAAIEHRQALGAGGAGVHVGTPLTAVLFRQLVTWAQV